MYFDELEFVYVVKRSAVHTVTRVYASPYDNGIVVIGWFYPA